MMATSGKTYVRFSSTCDTNHAIPTIRTRVLWGGSRSTWDIYPISIVGCDRLRSVNLFQRLLTELELLPPTDFTDDGLCVGDTGPAGQTSFPSVSPLELSRKFSSFANACLAGIPLRRPYPLFTVANILMRILYVDSVFDAKTRSL